MRLYISWESLGSYTVYLAEAGLTAGSLANEMQVKFNNLVDQNIWFSDYGAFFV